MSAPVTATRRRSQRGSSLIEVTLAMGLLAGVLGSLAGLFVLGAGGVHSGRRASQALFLAQSIVEEMRGWGYQQVYEEFGHDGAVSSYTVDTRSNPHVTDWHAELQEQLGGHAIITITALDGGAPPLETSTQMRMDVTVRWREGTRHRKVMLSAVRM